MVDEHAGSVYTSSLRESHLLGPVETFNSRSNAGAFTVYQLLIQHSGFIRVAQLCEGMRRARETEREREDAEDITLLRQAMDMIVMAAINHPKYRQR